MAGRELADYQALIDCIRDYWNVQIHDEKIVKHAVGSEGFFEDLDDYRFDKLKYLPRLVDYAGYRDKLVLDVGCGVGTDLVRFARGGAVVHGVDLSEKAIELAKKNFELRGGGCEADLRVMNAEALDYPDDYFDMVFAHGVIQYSADDRRLADEAHRVLKPGGEFIAQVYNRKGWLKKMSRVFKVPLEHDDAPGFKLHTIGEFRALLSKFSEVTITPERFPVRSRLHKGVKGFLYNTFFVGGFNLVPRPLVRRWGWHLMASAIK